MEYDKITPDRDNDFDKLISNIDDVDLNEILENVSPVREPSLDKISPERDYEFEKSSPERDSNLDKVSLDGSIDLNRPPFEKELSLEKITPDREVSPGRDLELERITPDKEISPVRDLELEKITPDRDIISPVRDLELEKITPDREVSPVRDLELEKITPDRDTISPVRDLELEKITPDREVSPIRDLELEKITPDKEISPVRHLELENISPERDIDLGDRVNHSKKEKEMEKITPNMEKSDTISETNTNLESTPNKSMEDKEKLNETCHIDQGELTAGFEVIDSYKADDETKKTDRKHKRSGETEKSSKDNSNKKDHKKIEFSINKSKTSKRLTPLSRPNDGGKRFKKSVHQDPLAETIKHQIEFQKRRDPEKSRRDIEKNKFSITSQNILKKMESGLVPPGMEEEFGRSESLLYRNRTKPERKKNFTPPPPKIGERYKRKDYKHNPNDRKSPFGDRKSPFGDRKSPITYKLAEYKEAKEKALDIGNRPFYEMAANYKSPPKKSPPRRSRSPLRRSRSPLRRGSPKRRSPRRCSKSPTRHIPHSMSPRRRSRSPYNHRDRRRETSASKRSRSQERFLKALVQCSGILTEQNAPNNPLPPPDMHHNFPNVPPPFEPPHYPPFPGPGMFEPGIHPDMPLPPMMMPHHPFEPHMLPPNMHPPNMHSPNMHPPNMHPPNMHPPNMHPPNMLPPNIPPGMELPPPFPQPQEPVGQQIIELNLINKPQQRNKNNIEIDHFDVLGKLDVSERINEEDMKVYMDPNIIKQRVENIKKKCDMSWWKLQTLRYPNKLYFTPKNVLPPCIGRSKKPSPLNRHPEPCFDFTSDKMDIGELVLSKVISTLNLENKIQIKAYNPQYGNPKLKDVSIQTVGLECDSCFSKKLTETRSKGVNTTVLHKPSVQTQVEESELATSRSLFAYNKPSSESKEEIVSLTHMTPAQILIAELSAKAKSFQGSSNQNPYQKYADNSESYQGSTNHMSYQKYADNSESYQGSSNQMSYQMYGDTSEGSTGDWGEGQDQDINHHHQPGMTRYGGSIDYHPRRSQMAKKFETFKRRLN